MTYIISCATAATCHVVFFFFFFRQEQSCSVISFEFIFLRFHVYIPVSNYFEHTLTEIDVKLQLWRKVSKPQRNGIRKVHAMWMVRKTLNAAVTLYYTSYISSETQSLHYFLWP